MRQAVYQGHRRIEQGTSPATPLGSGAGLFSPEREGPLKPGSKTGAQGLAGEDGVYRVGFSILSIRLLVSWMADSILSSLVPSDDICEDSCEKKDAKASGMGAATFASCDRAAAPAEWSREAIVAYLLRNISFSKKKRSYCLIIKLTC